MYVPNATGFLGFLDFCKTIIYFPKLIRGVGGGINSLSGLIRAKGQVKILMAEFASKAREKLGQRPNEITQGKDRAT